MPSTQTFRTVASSVKRSPSETTRFATLPCAMVPWVRSMPSHPAGVVVSAASASLAAESATDYAGSVGLSEQDAIDRGYDVATGKFPFTALGKAAILGKTNGFVKVVRETKYDELLGVHIVGAHATDLIAEACVALKIEATNEELMRTMHAHPTLSEAMAEAAHDAVGHAIHI